MGLFGKKEKEACPICGGEVTGLFKTKIAGKQEICRDCADKLSLPKDTIKNADVAFIREHLAFREGQAALYRSMDFTHSFVFGSSVKVQVDDGKQLLAISDSDMNCWQNPVILRYDQLLSYELWLENKKVDDDKTPGDTFSMTITAALGKFLGTASGKDQFFTIKLKTTDRYWPSMEILAMVPNHIEFSGYENNMSGIGNLIKCIIRKETFVMHY